MNKAVSKTRFNIALSCAAALLCTGGLQAQVLEEVIVTATKRAESLQEVPMSIKAFDRAELEAMGATEFLDYASKTPNLGFGADADGRFDSRKFGIRGVFSAGQTTVGGTTGLYIDEMPIPETMNPRLMDMERIEVLRGPQGTLYGARSMGGTIRLISTAPNMSESESRAHATLSNTHEGGWNWSADAALNVPLVTDKIGLRVMGYYGDNSGIFDRVSYPDTPGPQFKNEDVDSESYYGVQIGATLALSDTMTLTPQVIYQKVDADALPFADVSPGNFTQYRNFDLSEDGSDEFNITSLTYNWNTRYGNLVAVAGWMDRDVYENEDQTLLLTYFFGTEPIPSTITQDLNFDAFVQETRFTSDLSGPFQFTVGLFYQDTGQHVVFPPSFAHGLDEAFSDLIGVPFPPGALGTDMIYTTDSHFDTKELAGFFELNYDITEKLTGTFGGRYSDAEIDYFVTGDGIANGGYSEIRGSQSESRFSPKFLLESALNDDVTLYASASEGFRLGGVNGNIPADLCSNDLDQIGNPSPESLRTFDSDSLWSYELGAKTTLADNRVTLNAAGFFIDWDDVIQVVRLSCGFQYFANAGQAENKGFEVEMHTVPMEGLDLSFGVGYTDAKFTSVDNPYAGVEVGDRVLQVPEWTFTASGQYTFPLGSDGWDGFVRADYAYQSDSLSANNEVSDPRVRPSWNLLNLRAGTTWDKWLLALYVDNATDEHINLADNKSLAAEHPDRPRIVTNRPRTIGLEARYTFN